MTDLTADMRHAARRAGREQRSVTTVVVRSEMFSVASALSTLEEIISRARGRGECVLKVVHGPGDQRAPLRKALRQLTLEGTIQGFIPGEEWTSFHESARRLTQEFPVLKDDSGFGQRDPHATIVIVD